MHHLQKRHTGPGRTEHRANPASLMLYNYDVDGSRMKPEHEAELRHSVIPKLNVGGSVSIVGLASRSGSMAHNDKLSLDRANHVFEFLNRNVHRGLRARLVQGFGERKAKQEGYRDGTEDERFRSVLLFVSTGPVPPPPTPPENVVIRDIPQALACNGFKFSLEFTIPPEGFIDYGYLRVRWKVYVEGSVKPKDGSCMTTIRKDHLKAAFEAKLIGDTETATKAVFAYKLDEKLIRSTLEGGSLKERGKALIKPFEPSIKTAFQTRWRGFTIEPETGWDSFSTTPLEIRLAAVYTNDLIFEGAPYQGSFIVKLGFNVGPSAKLVAQAARALASEAGTVGISIAGAVIMSFAMTSLCAWAVADAKRQGRLDLYSRFYIEAHYKRVFGETAPDGIGVAGEDYKDWRELRKLGEKDAVLDARANLAKVSSPAARGTDEEALAAFRKMLIAQAHGYESLAKEQLQSRLAQKAREMAIR